MGNCHRDWLIRPSPWALKPSLSISLEQKPPHLAYNSYYPFRVVKTDILYMHKCLMISFKAYRVAAMVGDDILFYFAHPTTGVFSQFQSLLINCDLIFYHWEQEWSPNNQVWQASGSQQQEAIMTAVTSHGGKHPHKHQDTHIHWYDTTTPLRNISPDKKSDIWDLLLWVCA